MKIDLTRWPIDALVIGFLLLVLVGTFALAFAWIDDDGSGAPEEPVASETPGGETPEPGGEVQVTMHDNSFDPNAITVTAGATANFAVVNEGSAIHNMRIAGADNEYDTDDDAVTDPEVVPGGDEATLSWDVPAEAGSVDFRCDFHPTEMTGTVTVE
jgi:plastocyanin